MSCSISMPTFQKIVVTPHAIMRYRERVDDQKSDKEITKLLTAAVRYGTVVHTKKGHRGNPQYVLKHMGIEILAAKEKNDKAGVVTCYGDSSYAKWYRRQNYNIRRAYCA